MKNHYRYISGSIYLIMVLSLLVPEYLTAQQDTSNVQFHGSNVLDGQYSNRQGANSQVAKDFLRNDFKMTLSAFDIPFGSSFYITTEQNENTQRINNLSFYIDLNTLKKNRARIEANNKANKLKNPKAPWMIRFLSNFSKIEAGTVRPDYGELTLQGISVAGANIEFTHKIAYAAFASGTVKRPVNVSDEDTIFRETYKQKLLLGKLGVGDKKTTHFYMTYMQIKDETSVPMYDTEDKTSTLKPESNYIIGAEFRLSLLKNIWTIDGDAGVSSLTRDTRIEITLDSVYVNTILKKVPEFLMKLVDPNISTSVDYAYGFSTRLNLKTTTISGGYRWIGPGYFTLGNPMLINDRQTIDARVDQALFARSLSVTAYYKQFKDNLMDWKSGTTISNAYGFIARLTLKKAPYVQFSYTPNYQETKGDSIYIRNRMNIFSLSTGYKYMIKQLNSFTSLTFFNQSADFEREYDTLSQNNKTLTFTLNQIANFTKPFQVNFSASFSNTKSAYLKNNTDRDVISFVLSGTHTYKKKWRNTIGGKFMNSNSLYKENKLNLFWDSQVNIWKELDFGLKIDENIFNSANPEVENFNEFIVQCKLTFRW